VRTPSHSENPDSQDVGVMNRLNCAQERLQSGDHEPRLNFKGKGSQELLGNRDAAYIDVASFIGATIRKPRLSNQQKSARGNYATSFLYLDQVSHFTHLQLLARPAGSPP